VIIGAQAYRPIAERHGKPCVVAGFEPEQILRGLVHLLRQVKAGRAAVENVYPVAVSDEGNAAALALLERVFVLGDTAWRALGVIPESGLDLRPAYERFDAVRRFGIRLGEDEDHPGCLCGEVIQGKAVPAECSLFGQVCTPLNPVGPCMVSSEGTCSAWYKYNRPAGSADSSEART
jgi:hydrogenase expression/formation protein HypD